MQEYDTHETWFFSSSSVTGFLLGSGKEKFLIPFVPPILVKYKSTLGTLNTINIRYKILKC